MSRLLSALGVFALLLVAGCRGPTGTIAELGFPVFGACVGDETRFERPAPRQTGGLDAFADGVDTDADHRFAISFWPLASERRVALQVKARPMGSLPIERLVAAVYPGTRIEAERFGLRGALPAPQAPPIHVELESKQDANGNVLLMMAFERDAIPEGTERLLIPTLARFADGWIHVRYYQTALPAPVHLLSPAEVEALQRKEREAAAAAAPPAEQPTSSGEPTPAREPTSAEQPTSAEAPADGSTR